ncbi:hypothetical protein DYD21_09095 [Rhodohalobacter sp. SW132]|uniref:OmpP1/FadL family transporter n=1 Tax=Rhodohalobacter sp. SW132 TaxID=2293433 RepID=UPI000E2814C4|nr:outer membrane protein transport protein [Rhodohalobacter sp. SW132]REL33559.1 hypothetical protein DYD21_09095 [Rhodohalobacter sp. SW132]
MSALKRITLLGIFCAFLSVTTFAQNVNDPLLYSNQAVQFGDQRELINPVTGIMPGTALASGFATFLDNPASVALMNNSFGEFGLTYRTVNEDATYLGNTRSINDGQTTLSNLGFVYSFPTAQGSLVIGAGYNQHSAANRALGFNARNERSTITDQFKSRGNTYNDIAFNTFAIDHGDEFEDWDESILRTGFDQFGDFLGIRQQGEIIQSGYGGEYSAFIATEFQPNLMLGASVGIIAGRSTYDRVFQEVDEFNDYNFLAIDSSGDGEPDTDIDNILLSDEIRSRYSGFRARVGGLYKITPNINLGASYTLPSRISVDENYDATIRTTFNNNETFVDELDGQFSYSIRYPSRTNLGLAFENINGFSISLATEYVNYANVEIDFEDDALFEDQIDENEFISNQFEAIWNFKGGVSYRVNPLVNIRAGYAYQPSRFVDGIDDRSTFSAGAGFALNRDTFFEIGGLYTRWEEESAVYTYTEYDYSPLPDAAPNVAGLRSEDAFRTADLFQIMGTLRIKFN